MGEAQDQELHIIVRDSKVSLQSEGTTTSPANVSERQGLKWWTQIAFCIVFILLGQSIAILLGRLYYNKGGKSKWLATVVQLVGFPVVLPLYYFLPTEEKTQKDDGTSSNSNIPSPFKAASVYIFLGLFTTALCMMYSIGLQYLPVSTFSLVSASQLAFNAFFSFFLNSQKFTPYIINSLVLLTISSALLVFNSDSSISQGVSKAKHVLGFICAFACSAGYGLLLSLTQLAFKKVLKRESYRAMLDMIVYQAFVASCAAVVGLLASGEWKTMKVEIVHYELGKVSYLMTLIGIALTWQLFTIGLVGLLVKVSSLFSNVIATLGLPIVPVLAVIFFHDTMDGIKVVAMLLAIWGFVSYAYDQYLDYYKAQAQSPVSSNVSEASGNEN